MGKEPLNITRLIRLNDKYAAAESHQRGLARGNQAAEWHGNVYKRANATPPVRFRACRWGG